MFCHTGSTYEYSYLLAVLPLCVPSFRFAHCMHPSVSRMHPCHACMHPFPGFAYKSTISGSVSKVFFFAVSSFGLQRSFVPCRALVSRLVPRSSFRGSGHLISCFAHASVCPRLSRFRFAVPFRSPVFSWFRFVHVRGSVSRGGSVSWLRVLVRDWRFQYYHQVFFISDRQPVDALLQ